ncbi:MAG: ATP-binding protein [Pseudomonadota bacterium]
MLGAVLVAAVLAMTSYEIWRQRADTRDNAERSLDALTKALAAQTGRAFHSVELVIDATIASVRKAGGVDRVSGHDMHISLRERISGIPWVVGMAIVDSSGRMRNVANVYPPPERSEADFPYFPHHRDNPDPGLLINPPHASPVDGRVLIPVTRRLTAPDGSFEGVVLAAVDPDYFQDIYARLLPTEGGAFALFRDDGILLARAPEAGAAIGKDFSHLPVFQPGMPPRGLSWGPSPIDGKTRIVGYDHIAGYPLLINVSLVEDRLLAGWRGNTVRLSLAAVVAVAVVVVAVVVVAVTVLYRQLSFEERQSVALRRSEERLRFAQFALDHAADMVFWMDHEGHILYANQAACDALGYGADALNGVAMGDIDPAFAVSRWPETVQAARDGRVLRLESIHQAIDGRRYPVEVAVNHLDFGGADFVCAFARDISARRAAEADLAEKTACLEASNAELEQFAYVASHDLREPLRMVNSFVTMLARRYADKLDTEGREFIAFAQEGAVRMDRLILDLLEYSRVGRIERPFTAQPLSRSVDLAVKGLGLAAHEAGAVIEIQSDLPSVIGNEEELVRLYLNLVGNAIKYRHPDRAPVIRIGAEVQGSEVACWVADNGIGIAPEYYERIFRIFQRLHVRQKYEGTGIGLAICKKIVERHGGRIWVESVPEEGSTFRFTLKAG